MMTTIRAILAAFGALGWIELGAAFVVAVGCAGEFWIIANKLTAHVEPIGKTASFPWRVLAWIDSRIRPMLVRLKIKRRKLPEAKEHLLERFFVLLVAFGVTVEVMTLPFAMLEIAHLNKEAGEARRLAAQANLERAELEKDVAFSVLPRDTLNGLFAIERLSQFSNTVAIMTVVGSLPRYVDTATADILNTASLIETMLKAANWNFDKQFVNTNVALDAGSGWTSMTNLSTDWSVPGVQVSVNNLRTNSPDARTARAMKARDSLISELNSIGIEAGEGVGLPHLPPHVVVVAVGKKRNPLELKYKWARYSEGMDRTIAQMEKTNALEAAKAKAEKEQIRKSMEQFFEERRHRGLLSPR